tara:strand:+ start:512 stop:721 length:210 start_codon:yes stop_codon:yes gene_type:complete
MLLQIIEQWASLDDIAKAMIICCLCINVIIWAALCYMLDELDEPEKKEERVDLDAMLRNLRTRGHKVDD